MIIRDKGEKTISIGRQNEVLLHTCGYIAALSVCWPCRCVNCPGLSTLRINLQRLGCRRASGKVVSFVIVCNSRDVVPIAFMHGGAPRVSLVAQQDRGPMVVLRIFRMCKHPSQPEARSVMVVTARCVCEKNKRHKSQFAYHTVAVRKVRFVDVTTITEEWSRQCRNGLVCQRRQLRGATSPQPLRDRGERKANTNNRKFTGARGGFHVLLLRLLHQLGLRHRQLQRGATEDLAKFLPHVHPVNRAKGPSWIPLQVHDCA